MFKGICNDYVLPTVSIIVPVFNVEMYLSKCIDSIINQTYKNIEIILVDDGSQDNCPQICDSYKDKDERILVIHKKNGGLSDARNAGLNKATGDYITFIDSDDWYAADTIEVLVKLLKNKDAQIACVKNVMVSTRNVAVSGDPQNASIEILTSAEMVERLCNKSISTSVCNKLFDANIWRDQRFLKGRLNEDYLVLCEILMDDIIVATIDYAGYFYYVRPGSLTHSPSEKIHPVRDAMENAIELKEKAERNRPDLVKCFARMALYQARTLLIMMSMGDRKDRNLVLMLRNCLSECNPYIMTSNLSSSDKMLLQLAKRSIAIASIIANTMYKIKVMLNATR